MLQCVHQHETSQGLPVSGAHGNTGGLFGSFPIHLYTSISQSLYRNCQFPWKEQPPSSSSAWGPNKGATNTHLPAQQRLFKGSAVQRPLWPLGNLGYPGQPATATHWRHNTSHLAMLASLGKSIHYLLLGKKPTFSVDFRVTKESICFSSWIFNLIGCRTPQNIDRIPSMKGALPSCWRKTGK